MNKYIYKQNILIHAFNNFLTSIQGYADLIAECNDIVKIHEYSEKQLKAIAKILLLLEEARLKKKNKILLQ